MAFGETVNIKMLQTFLQPENGVISSSQTQGCNLFIKHNLNIFKLDNASFTLHCGKYPLIFITFKKSKGNSFKDVLDAFRDVIRDSFLEHGYLINSTRLNVNEKTRILLYTNKMFYKNLTEVQLQESLGYLSEKLYLHFSKKLTVLIDDFDAPIWKLLSTDFPLKDLHKTIFFVQELVFNILENKRYIERGIISSCTHLSNVLLRESIYINKINYPRGYPYVKYYGLTEDEVMDKLAYFKILQKYVVVKSYYNGYHSAGYNLSLIHI